MKDPLSLDKKIAEEFKLTGDLDPQPEAKLQYLNDQIGQMQSMLYRSRVDAILSQNVIDTAGEAGDLADQIEGTGKENRAKAKNEVRQIALAIRTLLKLRSQIDA